MNFRFRFIVISLLSQIVAPVLLAQQQPKDDVILTAMQDELSRNMKELALPNFDKPFYMMYGVHDQKGYVVVANLGSLTQSAETPQRFKTNTRILVGDYSFNDESLEDNSFSSPTAIEINLPLDDDYFGVRRSFWSSTDKVYRDAARHFEKHKETLKESGKTLDELPHRSFAKSEPVKLVSSLTPHTFDKAGWENKVRRLSALFIKHPDFTNSGVIVRYAEGHNYIVTSEGTIAKVPFSTATFMALGRMKNAAGEFNMNQITHYATSPDGLPTEEKLAEEITQMISKMEGQTTLSKFEEEYTGPVLLMGPAAAGIFSNVLFRGRESFQASHYIASTTGYQYNNEMSSMDSKIGKPVLHESVTVKMKPKLKSYNGTVLFGSFDIDDEGIVPPDELLVVERGVLKNLLNDRTISQPTQTANGFSSGPGVIEVTVTQKDSDKVLKEKLIAQAKKDGLDYGIIIRESPAMGMGMLNVYRVSVTDGKEELLKGALLNQGNLKTLKRILGASEKYQACNFSAGRDGGFNPSVGLISVIAPEAILIEEMQIQPFRMPILKEEEYVSNPLK